MARRGLAVLLVAVLVLSLAPVTTAGAGKNSKDDATTTGVGALASDFAPIDAYESAGDGYGGGTPPTWSETRDIAPLLPRWGVDMPGWGIYPHTESHTIDMATTLGWDEDWYKLTVTTADFNDFTQLSYRFDAYAADPDTDLVLDVYSNAPAYADADSIFGADPAALTSNDDTPWGSILGPVDNMRWSSVTFIPPSAGTYWIRVRPYWEGPATGFTGHAGAYTFRAKVGQVNRLSGADRIATAIRISQEGWPTNPQESQDSTVVLAYSMNYPDALAAGSLAGASGGPILLTPSGSLPSSVANEIKRLGARGVYIIGGTGVISQGVVDDLRTFLPANRIVRVAGADRYRTAVEVLKKTKDLCDFQGWDTMPSAAFLVSGTNFPDALAVAPMAYWNKMPVLLTPPTYLHSATSSAIAMYGINDVIVAGGANAVSDAAVGDLIDSGVPPNRILRVAGHDRYETAKEVAAWACDLKGPGPRGDLHVGTANNTTALDWLSNASFNAYASGASYPDALAGGPFAGKLSAPILLTPPNVGTPYLFGADGEIPVGSTQWFADLANNSKLPIQRSYLLGGTAAISSDVYLEIDMNTGWEP